VIAAVAREDLVTPRVEPSHPHGVLDGLGATIGEEHVAEALRGLVDDQRGCLAAYVIGVLGGNRAQPFRLGLDGGDDLGMLVTDVGVHQLARDVEVAVAVVVNHPTPLGPGDGQGVQCRLGGPGVEDMATVVGEDGGFGGGIGDRVHGSRVCHRPPQFTSSTRPW